MVKKRSVQVAAGGVIGQSHLLMVNGDCRDLGSFDGTWPSTRRLSGAKTVDSAVEPLQNYRAQCHQSSTACKQRGPLGSVQHLKDGVWIPSIMGIAKLYPEPVDESNDGG